MCVLSCTILNKRGIAKSSEHGGVYQRVATSICMPFMTVSRLDGGWTPCHTAAFFIVESRSRGVEGRYLSRAECADPPSRLAHHMLWPEEA